jgi:hypothetical protein
MALRRIEFWDQCVLASLNANMKNVEVAVANADTALAERDKRASELLVRKPGVTPVPVAPAPESDDGEDDDE